MALKGSAESSVAESVLISVVSRVPKVKTVVIAEAES